MRYRGEIDGLRAIAVTSVVLFHYGVPGLTGGFVGVDVFFVISGFLITSIVRSESLAGEFTFVSFYERRIRRLLPALFVVLAVVLGFGLLAMLPSDLDAMGRGGFFASLFSSNIFFFFEIDYFNQAAAESPLIHTWSLAVEEQFYIVLPVLVVLMRKARPAILLWAFVFLAAASFAWSAWSITRDPQATFYLLPSRAWELLAGSLLALAPQPRHKPWVSGAIGLTGLSMILASVFLYSHTTPFPGPTALLPVLGSVAVLYASNSGGGLSAKLLSAKPFAFIGKVSYSWYLWHWPLIAFYIYLGFDQQAAEPKIVLFVLSFVLAVLSWRFVEHPFRKPSPGRRPLWPVAMGAVGSIAAAGAFAVLAVLDGLPQRVSPTVLAFDLARHDWPETSTPCNGRSTEQARAGDVCDAGVQDANVPATFAVIGDSHADVLWPSVSRAAKAQDRRGKAFTLNGCPTLLGVNRINGDPRCEDFMRAAVEYISKHDEIRQVFLIARWGWYVEPAPNPSERQQFLTKDGMTATSTAENAVLLARGFADTKTALGDRQIVILRPIPEPGLLSAKQLGLSVWLGAPGVSPIDDVHYRKSLSNVDKILAQSGGTIVDPEPVLCSQTACDIMRDNKPIFVDGTHVSTYGSSLFDSLFAKVFVDSP